MVTPAKRNTKTNKAAGSMPTTAPAKDSSTASVKNSAKMRSCVAPIAFFTPISRVRSLTADSMAVMIPNPETTKDTALSTVKT